MMLTVVADSKCELDKNQSWRWKASQNCAPPCFLHLHSPSRTYDRQGSYSTRPRDRGGGINDSIISLTAAAGAKGAVMARREEGEGAVQWDRDDGPACRVATVLDQNRSDRSRSLDQRLVSWENVALVFENHEI